MAIVKFPERSRPASIGASKIQILTSRFGERVGAMLNKLGFPGAIRNAVIRDELTDYVVEVSTGPLFTKISVNGRDYYFDRLTGRYDGSGCGCS